MAAGARRDFLWLVPLLAIYFGFLLGGRALWSPVEGRYAEIAREMTVSGDYVTPRLNGVKYFEKPPLFYWLEALALHLFGSSEWSLRLWPAIFAVLGCLIVYAAGSSLFERRTAMAAAAVLATSPLYYGLARVAVVDMAFTTFLSAGFFSFLWALRRPPGKQRRALMWSFYIAVGLATLTKGLLGIVLPALVVGAWLVFTRAWKVLKEMHLLSGIAIAILIAAPWHIAVAMRNPDFASFYLIEGHLGRFVTMEEGGLGEAWIYIPVLLVLFFPWIALVPESFRALKSNRSDDDYAAGVFLALWAAIVFIFFSLAGSRLFTYVLPVLPPLALLVGRTLSLWWEGGLPRAARNALWAVALAMLLLGVVGLSAPQYRVERYSNWPSLAPPSDDTTVTSMETPGFAELGWLKPYLYAEAALLFAGAAALVIFARRRAGRDIFIALAATTGLFLSVVDSGLPVLNDRRSVKHLAHIVKERTAPGDEVAAYHGYYQDLPFYLERIVTVVGWRGELDFGARAEDTSRWMIDDGELRRRWNGGRQIYLFMAKDQYARFAAALSPASIIAGNPYNVVVTNRAR